LTAEYQAIYRGQLEEQAKGKQGIDPTIRCISPGMPRIMHVYSPMEIVVTPETQSPHLYGRARLAMHLAPAIHFKWVPECLWRPLRLLVFSIHRIATGKQNAVFIVRS
jgi:hypothetical protein